MRSVTSLRWVTVLLALLAWPGLGTAQSSLYSRGGCRVTQRDASAAVNVTCTCRQYLQQTDGDAAIDELTIVGCLASEPAGTPGTRLALTAGGGPLDEGDFLLLRVRSIHASQLRLDLRPVAARPPAVTEHPLERLHVELSTLERGLPDGALRGLPRLAELSLVEVGSLASVESGALSDLPQLRSLTVDKCTLFIVKGYVVARTPRLQQLHIANNEISFLRSGAVAVEAESAPSCAPDTAHAPFLWMLTSSAPSFFFVNNSITTMSQNAVSFSTVQHLVISGNKVREMYPGSLDVQLDAPCAGEQPLVEFTNNDVGNMQDGALRFTNRKAEPAGLMLGGNRLEEDALSPGRLQLDGAFQLYTADDSERRRDHYDCACCGCNATQQLTAAALQEQPDQLQRDVFLTAVATAACAGGQFDSYLEFADQCDPAAGLARRVRDSVPPEVSQRAAGGQLAPGAAAALAAATLSLLVAAMEG